MDNREDILADALIKNAQETSRWEEYQKEHEIAIENINSFSKRLTVDVMVPIGRKAFMPGHLIHTNDVLVGHFQGYFYNCSTHKAKEICEIRLKNTKEHLNRLNTEAKMWQDKLNKPYEEGVYPSSDQVEILEDYDEEKEIQWRKEHKLRVKEYKKREKLGVYDENEKVEDILEGAEWLEQNNNEFENMEVNEISNDLIMTLMNEENVQTQKKVRIAHNKLNKNEDEKISNDAEELVLPKVHYDEMPENNNCNEYNNALKSNSGDECDDFSDDDLPEVSIIKQQAQYLLPEERTGFYKYYERIVEQKMSSLSLKDIPDVVQRVHFDTMLEQIRHIIDKTEEFDESDVEVEESTKNDAITDQENAFNKKQKKSVTFALEDDALVFRRNETVADMLQHLEDKPLKKENFMRDIITLDDTIPETKEEKLTKLIVKNKRQAMLEKVEQNLNYVSENQSTKNFDLVGLIIDDSNARNSTKHIHFTHSAKEGYKHNAHEYKLNDNVPISPADFYIDYLKCSDVTTNITDKIKNEKNAAFLLKKSDLLKTCEDKKIIFPKPDIINDNISTNNSTSNGIKSILRNKNTVQNEQHWLPENVVQPKPKEKKINKREPNPLNKDKGLSVYDKVIKDVVEKNIGTPDPLPDNNFVDAHAPKKRISRFKQLRSGTQPN